MVQRRKMRLDHPDSKYVFTIFQYSNFMTANRAFFFSVVTQTRPSAKMPWAIRTIRKLLITIGGKTRLLLVFLLFLRPQFNKTFSAINTQIEFQQLLTFMVSL